MFNKKIKLSSSSYKGYKLQMNAVTLPLCYPPVLLGSDELVFFSFRAELRRFLRQIKKINPEKTCFLVSNIPISSQV
jgi:hypothetical protein